MARVWRVHHADLPAEQGAVIDLSRDEAHYVKRVLRLGQGDRLQVFDGKGAEFSATVLAFVGNAVTLRLEEQVTTSVEATLLVSLFQGLCRADRMEWVIQKGTEIGVRAVFPMRTERSDVPQADARRLVRWGKVAIEAARQSGRSVVPEISVVEDLPPEPRSEVFAVLLDRRRDATPLGELLGIPPRREIWLAVGPESGFSEPELKRWAAAGWRRAGLGPRTMRTETAGLVAAAIALNRWGDLGSPSG